MKVHVLIVLWLARWFRYLANLFPKFLLRCFKFFLHLHPMEMFFRCSTATAPSPSSTLCPAHRPRYSTPARRWFRSSGPCSPGPDRWAASCRLRFNFIIRNSFPQTRFVEYILQAIPPALKRKLSLPPKDRCQLFRTIWYPYFPPSSSVNVWNYVIERNNDKLYWWGVRWTISIKGNLLHISSHPFLLWLNFRNGVKFCRPITCRIRSEKCRDSRWLRPKPKPWSVFRETCNNEMEYVT